MSSLEKVSVKVFPEVEIGRNSARIFMSKDEYLDVDTRLGKSIKIFLRISRRIEKKMGEIDSEFFDLVKQISGINCHKTVLYLCGLLTKKTLLNPSLEDTGHKEVLEIIEDAELDKLLAVASRDVGDVDLVSGSLTVVFQGLLNAKKFPETFHMLVADEHGKYFPKHSVLILGKSNAGNLIAFHKNGPYSDNAFEFFDFNKFAAGYAPAPTDLFCALPAYKK